MILEVKELNKQFERSGAFCNAVSGVNLCAEEGDFIGITGKSGSGKSTLFHMITGLLKPTSGAIYIEHVNIAGGDQERSIIRRDKIGYIMQGQNLLSNYNVIHNVCMPCYMTGVNKEIRKKGLELLKLVGLEGRSEDFPRELSGGELQRVAIARSLILSPAIIIADEPTANLDPDNALLIIQLLKTVSQTGTAVVVSTHNTELLYHFSKLYTMSAGQIFNGLYNGE